MAKLINFNTTSLFIAMSKNTGSDNLAQELALMPQALNTISLSRSGHSVILARMVRGLSSESWQEACQAYALNQWHALPVADGAEDDLDTAQSGYNSVLPVSPFREVAGALTRGMFLSLLKRELLRLSRNGGSLSLVAATLANRREVISALGEAAVTRLDALLGATLLSQMDACDGLGLARKGVYICSLPGLGQLAARRFAETARDAFAEASQPFFPSGGLGAGQGGACAMGIVNVLQGESCCAADLLKRARAALDQAVRKQGAHIHQEAALAPFEGTTLVHSSEKRFLFFGGESS